MKNLLSIIVFALFSFTATAQVSKTVNVTTAGTLSSLLTPTELSTVTNLTITGNIDARDVKTMRDNMPVLAVLDIGAVIIQAYTGSAGTYNSSATYSSNEMPQWSFCKNSSQGKLTLKAIVLPNSITLIGSYAFGRCYNLNLGILTISSTVMKIGEAAFFGCKITKIICLNPIPPTLGQQAFDSGSGSGTFIFVPAGAVDNYKAAWSGYTIASEKHVMINNLNAGSLAATIIGLDYGPISSITHLVISGNVNSLDISQINNNMTLLTELDMTGTSLENNVIPEKAFYFKRTLITVKLPNNITSIGSYAFAGCGLLSDLALPLSLLSIGNGSFSGCSHFTGSLTIPNLVTSIGSSAFDGCSGFYGGLSIGSGIKSIGNYTFNGCTGLTGDLTIPNTVTSLGTYAFQNCSGFNGTLSLSNTLTTVSDYAFAGCSQLSGKIEVPLSVASIGSYAFQGCAKITELSLGKNLTSIGDYSLDGCTSFTKISVPRSTPPTVFAHTFRGIPVESCTINVPAGASISYQTANYWGIFNHYIESLSSDNYSVTISIGAGGSVKENNVTLGNGSVLTAEIGSTKTFTFIPNAGYALAAVSYGGVDVTSQLVNNQYTTPAINANATLVVTFKKAEYLLSIKSADSGTVELLCEYGATPSFHFTASSGWKVNTLLYNGVDITNSLTNGVYKVPAVSADALLTVSFEQTNALVSTYSNVKVYTNSSEIIIEGSSEGEIISLFSINGKQIKSQKSQGERIVIPAQKDVIYFVKTESKTFKVIL